MEIRDLLHEAASRNASDLYLKAGCPPTLRVNGVTVPLEGAALNAEEAEELIAPLLRPRDEELLKAEHSVNLARTVPGAGRFRIIVYSQQGSIAMVARRVQTELPTVEILGLPPILNALVKERTGLLLVTGATGCGKSTTLAAMVHHRNVTMPGHIVTVEDPIEFVHADRCSIVTQRELGLDCNSFERGLQDALRQAPDLILIGEIRERKVMEDALNFAETGHLVLGTLHSTNANQTIERVLGFFPPDAQPQVLLQLSLGLRAIVSQRLLPRADGSGRVPCTEILVATERARELIRQRDADALKHLMRNGAAHGMVTFDQSLFELCTHRLITPQVAMAAADSPGDLRLRLRGFEALSVT